MKLTIETLAAQINDAAPAYDVGGLQQLRAKLHGKRPRTKKLFHKATVFEHYMFHDGGRTELQFNVGIETRSNGQWWRHGVAFSFRRGQSLPDPTVLDVKIDCFNEWLLENSEQLAKFRMWHWHNKKPSKDRKPSKIPENMSTSGAFVFLGDRYRKKEVDVDRILRDFDILYPLYEYVESTSQQLIRSVALPEEVSETGAYAEGAVSKICVNRYERDPRARKKCIDQYGATCVVCGFDFGQVFGEIMEGFIHVHHLHLLADVGPEYEVDPVEDLRPLCPNCHAVTHRKDPPYSLDEVRGLMLK